MTQPGPAIVTGASRGIGAALAKTLAAEGRPVVVNYAGSAAAAADVAAAIEAAGGRALAVQADMAEPAGAARLFDAAEQEFGPVALLVNNAGVMTTEPIAAASDESFARQVSINLTGTFHGMREGARRIVDGGRIVNFSTSVLALATPGYGVYVATKAAVEAMSRVLAKELAPRRITVNCVAPGPVETELFLAGKSPELLARIVAGIPAGRLGRPEDIAGVVRFLAGPDAGWVTGQTLRANGGMA